MAAGHPQRGGQSVHLHHERRLAPRIPYGKGEGDVVGRSGQQPLEELAFGQHFADRNRNDGFVAVSVLVIFRHVRGSQGDGRPTGVGWHWVIAKDHDRGRQLGERGDRHRSGLIRIGGESQRRDLHRALSLGRPWKDRRATGNLHRGQRRLRCRHGKGSGHVPRLGQPDSNHYHHPDAHQ